MESNRLVEITQINIGNSTGKAEKRKHNEISSGNEINEEKITQADSSLCAFISGGFTKMNELENADTLKLFLMKMNVGMMCLSDFMKVNELENVYTV